MTTERDEKCKDRIKAEYARTIKTLREIWEYERGPDRADDEREAGHPDHGPFKEYGLGFDYVAPGTFEGQRRGYFRYQLSWGGPSDEFRFFCDERPKPVRIEYWFMDWFDGAKKVLGGADYDLLADIFDDFDDCGMVKGRMREALED